MNIKRSILIRVRVAFLVIFLFSAAIVLKIILIQYVDNERWEGVASETGAQYQVVKATRGNIYSNDASSLMATSLPFYRLAIDPSVIKDDVWNAGLDSLAQNLSKYYGDKSKRSYKILLTDARLSGRKYLVLNRRLIDYQAKKTMTGWPIFRKGRIKGGLLFEKVDRRFKPFSHLGSRTIGFIDENNQGRGLEFSFDEALSGKNGRAFFQKTPAGNWRQVFDGSEIHPEEGFDIQTTLDISIQDVAESSLLNALEMHEAEYGCVVLMEVATGEIKALSNLTRTSDGKYAEMYNYAVQGLAEPGSTFKLASMMAVLEESGLHLNTKINTGDGIHKFFDIEMKDHKEGGFGVITLEKAFAVSSNIAISRLVDKYFGHQPEKFVDYMEDFGLTKPLGFQMIGEGIPQIKSASEMSGISLPWMSIGHELQLTPLQTLSFYNAVANDGKMISPIIVKNVLKSGKIVDSYRSEKLVRQVASDETLRKLRTMLESVVNHGTATNIKNPNYQIAGKTGTAQKVKASGGYEKKYYTSFAGYFPAEAPKYSCIVIIDEPKGYRQYGTDVAAPVFKEIADKLFVSDLEIHPPLKFAKAEAGVFPVIKSGEQSDLTKILSELGIKSKGSDDQVWVKAAINGNDITWRNGNIGENTVPDVTGMSLRDALFLLESRQLRVTYKGSGRVVNQDIPAGAKINKGKYISLDLEL